MTAEVPPSDPEWDRFRESAFGDPYLVWHDGPSFVALRDAWLADADHVAGMLSRGLATGDPLAATSVRELADLLDADRGAALRSALDAAVSAFDGPDRATLRIAAAEALAAVTGDPAPLARIEHELATAPAPFARMDAAIALGRISYAPDTDAVRRADALAAAVAGDPDYLVRYHAATALVRWAEPGEHTIADDELFDLVRRDAEPARWRRAADALRARLG